MIRGGAHAARSRAPMRAGAVIFAGLLALAACRAPAPSGPRFVRAGQVVTGVVLPIDGGELPLERLRGRPVVLHFFVTWQLETITDLAELRRVHSRFGESVTIVDVGLDPGNGRLLVELRASESLPWLVARPSPALFGPDATLGDRLPVVPATVVVDAGGVAVWVHTGPLAEGELATRLAPLTD